MEEKKWGISVLQCRLYTLYCIIPDMPEADFRHVPDPLFYDLCGITHYQSLIRAIIVKDIFSNVTSSHHTPHHLTSHHIVTLHLTSPHLISSHITSSHLTLPHFTIPHLTSRNLIVTHTTPHCTAPHHNTLHWFVRRVALSVDGIVMCTTDTWECTRFSYYCLFSNLVCYILSGLVCKDGTPATIQSIYFLVCPIRSCLPCRNIFLLETMLSATIIFRRIFCKI